MATRGRGPAPTPTALKILKGNPGRRPLNTREAAPELGMPAMPARLRPEAQVVWKELAPILMACGLLTKADGRAFALVCDALADYDEDRGAGKRGDTSFTKLRQMLPEFGLTPASRSRIKVDLPQAKSKVDEFREKYGG